MSYLERNFQLIKERMIQQMEISLKLGKDLIDTELDTGLLNFIVKPLVKLFYDNWAKNDARDGTLKQINLTLDSGKKLLLNGNSIESFNEIINYDFPKYLEADQISRQCHKGHKNYERLAQASKETFTNYLREVVKLLEVKEDVENYGDLCRTAFKSKESAEQNLMHQLDFTNKAIKIVEADPAILKIPVGRKIILKALRNGYKKTRTEFIKSLNETYSEN
ncbi:MAG: hypothetical protein ACW986_02610 [Promethearchaeota archaeon]